MGRGRKQVLITHHWLSVEIKKASKVPEGPLLAVLRRLDLSPLVDLD